MTEKEKVSIIQEKWVLRGNHSSETMEQLINVQPLKKMVECALISPYIKNRIITVILGWRLVGLRK